MDNNIPEINVREFVDWVEADPHNRVFKIDYSGYIYGRRLRVWVYDSKLNECQYVTSVNEIKLVDLARERKIKQFEALKAEFESEGNHDYSAGLSI